MDYSFGDLITQHLSRKRGLSQNKLANGIGQDPAVIAHMCQGRRLSGPKARKRICEIIAWFYEQGVLDCVSEANSLLKAANHAELNITQQEEEILLARLKPQFDIVRSEPEHRRPPHRPVWLLPALATVALAAIILAIVVLWVAQTRPSYGWQANLSPLNRSVWNEISAKWEDAKPGARLRENNPAENFGKVESDLIEINIDQYPILHIRITKVDPGASVTLQILEKPTDAVKDVLKDIKVIGDYKANIAEEMGWQGTHSFTLNVWIGGEGKSVTLDLICLETK
jgi:hypothetical protein